jgi:hypothetical protein
MTETVGRLVVRLGENKWTKPLDAIVAGAARFAPVTADLPSGFTASDVLITWSPFRATPRAETFAAAKAGGARVIVLENGWLSPIGGARYYQVALDGWNGTGRFPVGDAERWKAWSVDVGPWRTQGRHILVVGNNRPNTTGDPRRTPIGWAESVEFDSAKPVVRRLTRKDAPLDAHLRDAWCTVVWTSTAAVRSVIAGVPVFYQGPNLICAALARTGGDVEYPSYPDREPVLERLAWGQWTPDEIATGEPFARLFALPHAGEPERVLEEAACPTMWTVRGHLRAMRARLARRSVVHSFGRFFGRR